MFRRFMLRLATLALVAVAVAPPVFAAESDIPVIFAPLTWNRAVPGPGLEYTQHDFPALLQPDAPWQQAASHVSVLALPGSVITSYPQLPSVIAFLNSRPWQVALGMGMMFGGGVCGVGVEGFSGDPDYNHGAVAVARKMKAAGGRLDYVIMDSPLYFGRYDPQGCRFSIAEVARRTAATARGVQAYFPNVRFIDAEGPGQIANAVWLPEMTQWFAAFHAAVGQPIVAVPLDLHWTDLRPGNTWQNTMEQALAVFHKDGVQTGLIIDAAGGAGVTDASWMAANRLHIDQLAATRVALDFIAFGHWEGHPTVNLPETSPLAETSLVDYAIEALDPVTP